MYELQLSMPYVLGAVAFLVLCGAPSYRATATIILAVSLFNIALSEVFIVIGEIQHNGPDNPYLYITVATIESLTCMFLLACRFLFAPGNSNKAEWMALIGGLAVLINAAMIAQMLSGKGLIYYNYMMIIFVLVCAQIILFFGGIYESVCNFFHFIATLVRDHRLLTNRNRNYRNGVDSDILGKRK